MNTSNGYDDDLGAQAPEGLTLPPWERRDRYGFLNALYLTIKDVLLVPGRVFRAMPSEVGLVQPILFAIVIGVISTFFAWMWSLASSSLQMLVAEDVGKVLRAPLGNFIMFVTSPVWIPVLLFIEAGLTHLMLMIVGGNKLGFEATFRVMAYSEATSILLLLPICGSPIALVWSLVVTVIGLYAIHDTDPWRAVIAVALPTILCLTSVAGLVTVLVAGMH